VPTSHYAAMRALIEAIGVAPLADLIRRPGISGVYRLTVFHHDGRARDTVSTLFHGAAIGNQLETVVRLMFDGKPLVRQVLPQRFDHFVAALNKAGFDHLPDQPDIPPYGVDVWLLERAAGSFTKSVVLAPQRADGVYATLVAAIQTDLPDALREVR
jgi:hypothetical protein